MSVARLVGHSCVYIARSFAPSILSVARSVGGRSVVSVARLIGRVYRSHALTIHRFFQSLGHVIGSSHHSCVSFASLVHSIDPVHRSLARSFCHIRGSSGHSCVYRSLTRALRRSRPSFGGIRGMSGHSCVSLVCALHRSRPSLDRLIARCSVVRSSQWLAVIRVYRSIARSCTPSILPVARSIESMARLIIRVYVSFDH